MSHTLNLHIRPKRQLKDGHTTPRWLGIFAEPLRVHLVDGRKVLHVGDEDVDFDDFVDVGTCCFEDC